MAPTTFLLESVEGGEKWARYSFVGSGARAIFRARGREVEWSEGGETQRWRVAGDPMEVLREKLREYRPVARPDFRCRVLPAARWAMVAWDWVRFVEKLPDDNPDPLGLPDLWFVLPETGGGV